ncbi:MAG: stage II sporulation protein M [Bacteroidota bacterium]
MREPAFLRKNKDKWQEYEEALFGKTKEVIDPDRLGKLYIQLIDDLAYARTFYPKSQIVKYLNGLAARTHLLIYENRKPEQNRLYHFFAEELPLIYYRYRKFLIYSFAIFTFFTLISALITTQSDELARKILGDGYVNMTIENIKKGEPGDVYRGGDPWESFLYIAYNNVMVMFMAFIKGIIFMLGTIQALFINGLMLGSFLTFFHRYGALWDALPIIYIHGTLEITAIVISGGAGFMLGHALMFPGTYKRIEALQRNASAAGKMFIGLVPVVIFAAFLETFVTRFTHMPLLAKLLIIILSLSYLAWFYWILPNRVARRVRNEFTAQAHEA